MITHVGYATDAEACGKIIREILERRKPKVWRHLGDSEGAYIAWAATWAFHWAERERQRREHLHP